MDQLWAPWRLAYVATAKPSVAGDPCFICRGLDELTAEELLETMETLRRMVGALDELMHPDGYNIGLNLGRAAGAGLPGHLHWHIVPRWHGDTNFMPVLTDAKVIAQSLEALYDLLNGRLQSVST